jgi:S-adenosylmethionine synthetase
VREAVEYEVIDREGLTPLDAVAERIMSQVERDLLA